MRGIKTSSTEHESDHLRLRTQFNSLGLQSRRNLACRSEAIALHHCLAYAVWHLKRGAK